MNKQDILDIIRELNEKQTETLTIESKTAKKDKPKFSEFSDEEVLLTMGVITKLKNKIFPTVAGIMVLGYYPQKFFPQWFVAAMVFPGFEVAKLGEDGQRFNNNKRIDGNILDMYKESINFIERNMKVKMRLNDKTGLREDIPEFPIKSIREAVSNLLIHRDLSPYKESVYSSISMFKNRIEFRNVGNLYGTNTLDNIISERDVEVRNKTTTGILEVLNEVIENRHTGIRTIINEMKKAELPKPIFKNEREDFSVTFYNGEYPELYPEEIKNTQVDKIDKCILEFCKSQKSAKEIADKLGYKYAKTLKKNHLRPLIEKGLLKMTIPDKPKSSKQKYITINNKELKNM